MIRRLGKPKGKAAFCALRVKLRSESDPEAGSAPRKLEKKTTTSSQTLSSQLRPAPRGSLTVSK